MTNSAEALRRWMGMFCLATASGMLIWGRTVLVPHLRSWGFAAYWLVCLAFAVAAVWIGLIDLITARRRMAAEHRELVRAAFERIKNGGSKPPTEEG